MNKIAYFLFPLLIVFLSLQATTNYPFPTHNTYYAGVIKPSNVTQTQMDQKIQTLYNEWKQEYLRTVPDAPDQAYVFYNEDQTSEPENAVSVSEGQGYGMLLAVYMAGYDAEAQLIFDNLFRFYEAFPSVFTPALMGWQQVEEDGKIVYNPEGGDDSATDGDLDIAFALLLADKQWGSNGFINYLEHANAMISDILEGDVNMEEFTLKLGDWVYDGDAKFGKATRPSDFALNHLKNFSASLGNPAWQSVINKTYSIINELFDNFSPNTGLLPDFSEFKNNAYVPADVKFLERIEDGYYSWNACRTPWRIATDYILTGDTRALTQLTALNSWIRSNTNQSPYNIKAGYKLDGTPLVSYDDLAFTTPFAVSAMINASNQNWLNALWSYTSAQPTSDGNYFANTLRLLCFLVVSGNWWTPLNLPP
jgi:endo-1,4-beta-D-glucanase Y